MQDINIQNYVLKMKTLSQFFLSTFILLCVTNLTVLAQSDIEKQEEDIKSLSFALGITQTQGMKEYLVDRLEVVILWKSVCRKYPSLFYRDLQTRVEIHKIVPTKTKLDNITKT